MLASTNRATCIPLLGHCLQSHDVTDKVDLLKFLLGVAMSSPADDLPQPGTKPNTMYISSSPHKKRLRRGEGSPPGEDNIKIKAVVALDSPGANTRSLDEVSSKALSDDAQSLLRQALESTGVVQNLALGALAARADESHGTGSPGVQRQALLGLLVEAGLEGASADLVAAAAKGLPVLPADVASFVLDMVSEEGGDETLGNKVNYPETFSMRVKVRSGCDYLFIFLRGKICLVFVRSQFAAVGGVYCSS